MTQPVRLLLQDRDRLFEGLPDRPSNDRRKQASRRDPTRSGHTVSPLRSLRFSGKLKFITITHDGDLYSIPLLLWNGWIDKEVSHWLRYLAISMNTPVTSLKTYASIIRDFTRFRRRHEVLWDEVTDLLIKKFQSFKLAKGVKPKTVNQYTDVVFGFYVWLEETGRLENHVQLDAGENLGRKQADFKITSRHSKPSNKQVNDAPGRIWNFRLRRKNDGKKRRHTPNKDEIDKIHDAVLDQKHGERNSLLFLWAEKTGARRFEVLQINVRDLPSEEERDRIAEIGGNWAIQVFRKGRGDDKRDLLAPVDLLRLTALYVKYERSKIVERCIERGRPVPDGLFLTDRGGTLSKSTLTGLARTAFIKAGVLRSSYHRFRAVFATQETKRAVEALESGHMQLVPGTNWTRSILIRVAELLDHSNLESLEHYLDDYLNARIQRAQSSSGINTSASIDAKRREIEALDRRIASRIALLKIMVDLNTQKDRRVGMALDKIADEILAIKD